MPKNGFRLAAYLLFTTLWSGCLAPARAQDLSAYIAARQVPLSLAQRRMAGAVRYAVEMATQRPVSGVHTALARTLGMRSDGMIDVYIHVENLTATVRQVMRQYGAVLLHWHTPTGLVHAAVAPDDLDALATLPFVRWIRTPLPGVLRAGSVTSQGDGVLGAEEARATFGIDGTGVRVGIISDSLIDWQRSVASGDLPADVVLLDDGSNINPSISRTDEGRAVAEIVHDLAPGATLLFHSGFPDGLSMIRAINALMAAGADVIIDDIGFFDEPVFEDGPVAQAVQNAINRGVVYVTAAGNDADRHYRGRYQEFVDGDSTTHLHDFGNGDSSLAIQILPGRTMLAVLQWPNRFNGSANTADYDLLVFDANGTTALFDATTGRCEESLGFIGMCASIGNQTGSAPPLEIVQIINNTGNEVMVLLMINLVSGEALDLNLQFNRDAEIEPGLRVAANSIFGHACVPGALAVGAVDVNDVRGGIEFFSSRGPCEIVFPTPQTRLKPDLVATDRVLVSPSLPGFRPFGGTSAAAPHVAAIAALLMDASGGPGVLSNAEIADRLRQTAIDLGATGEDPVFGAGVVDALAAVTAVFSPSRGNSRIDASGGGGGCSILPVALSPTLPLLDALGNIFLPLLVMVAIQSWRRYRSR